MCMKDNSFKEVSKVDYKITTLICRAEDNNLVENRRRSTRSKILRASPFVTEVSYCSAKYTRASYYIKYQDSLSTRESHQARDRDGRAVRGAIHSQPDE